MASLASLRRVRTKSGCLTCRRRRKKCDERKPTCANCARWQTGCNWPSFHIIEASPTSLGDSFRARKVRFRKPTGSSLVSGSQESRGRLCTKPNDVVSARKQPAADRCIFNLVPAEATTLFSHDDDGMEWQMLEFFILEGSKGLCGLAPSNDPFLRLALQLAQSDNLIWSAILALSGSRMSALCCSPTVEHAALHYYDDTLVHLQSALDSWPPETSEDVIRLLSASMLLCHEESMRGNPRNSLHAHLRAARKLITIAQQYASKQHYSEIYVVLFEVFTYYSTMVTLMHSASELDIQANLESQHFYHSLTSSRSFGYIMIAACEVFTLMPYVAQFNLMMRKLGKEQRASVEVDLLYRRLAANIVSWQSFMTQQLDEISIKVTLIYQDALLAFLHTSYLCDESDQSTLDATLKPIVADALSLFESIKSMPASATAFWPTVILGSCLREQQDKDRLLSYVNQQNLKSGIQGRASEALEWMWERQDERVFGPIGLERFAQETNTGLFIG